MTKIEKIRALRNSFNKVIHYARQMTQASSYDHQIRWNNKMCDERDRVIEEVFQMDYQTFLAFARAARQTELRKILHKPTKKITRASKHKGGR